MKRWFEQLSVAWKLGLICGFFLLPNAAMLWFVITGFSDHIEFARREQLGNEYQRPLMELLFRLPQHGTLAQRGLAGDAKAVSDLVRQQAEVDAAFETLAQVDARIGRDLQFTEEGLAKRNREHVKVVTVRQEWQALKTGWAGLSAEELGARHRHLLRDVRTMITHAGDMSNLILDPDLDSYYLMDATLLGLPRLQDRLAETLEETLVTIQDSTLPWHERRRHLIFPILLRKVDYNAIEASIKTALNEDANFHGRSATLHTRLPSALTACSNAVNAFITVTDRLSHTNQPAVSAKEYQTAGEQARAASHALWTLAVGELDTLLDLRVASYQRRRNLSLLVAAAACAAAVGFVTFITQSISGPLRQQAAALTSANAALQASLTERSQAQAELQRVQTETLAANQALQAQITERDRVEAALRQNQVKLISAETAALNMMEDLQASRRKIELAYEDLQREVAGRQQVEAQLLQSQKLEAIGQLAGGVAHDFNNILGAMMMQTELTSMDDNLSEPTREGLRQIHAGAERAANLTRQLLLFSRKEVMQACDLDLNDSVTSLSRMLQRIIGEDVRLELRPHPAALLTHAAPGCLTKCC